MAEMDGKDIEWMKDQISDIGHDTDEILERRTAIETAYAKKNHQKPTQTITKN